MLFNEIEQIVQGAREASVCEKDSSISKTQRLKGIRDNNDMEKELHREAITLTQIEDYNFDEYDSEKLEYDSNNELDLFIQIQNEEWGNENEQ